MNAHPLPNVDSLLTQLLANWPALLTAAVILLGILTLTGCPSPIAARIGVEYATLKVIDGDSARAERIVEIVSTARLAVTNETATSVDALQAIVVAKIDWDRLDAADAALARVLISAVAEELQARIAAPAEPGQDPPTWKLKADRVLGWVESAARSQR